MSQRYIDRGGDSFAEEFVVLPEHYNTSSEVDLKSLYNLWLNRGLHGLCFSMYADGQKPGDIISRAQIRRRMSIIAPYTTWVRSFSCIEGNELVPQEAKKKNLKTLVGCWLGDDDEKNEEEIKALIKLGKKGVIDIAAVGNEVLYRNDMPKAKLMDIIKRVKTALPGIAVSYVDAYYEFTRHPDLADLCDVILVNCYPFWEGTAINDAFGHMQAMYFEALAAANGKPVMITETGWPSQGEQLKAAVPSGVNAMRYFINVQRWSLEYKIPMFYFSSFDESWKIDDEGTVGAYWGIWDKDENLKF